MGLPSYEIRGNLLVILGSIIILMDAVEHVCDAIIAFGEGRFVETGVRLFCALGGLFIGIEVWRAR